MNLLPETQKLAIYNPPVLVYDAEIVELYPEEVAEPDYFKCPTAEDIAQAERDLEASSKMSHWEWLKNVLG